MGNIKVYKKVWIGLAALLCAAALLIVQNSRKKEIVLEFGMFTGSNWDVATANSFVLIDKAISTAALRRSIRGSVSTITAVF